MALEGHVIVMAALGRRFKLGDLYDYRNDHIVAGKHRLLTNYMLLLLNVWNKHVGE